MQFASMFKYMVPYTASYSELTFSSKRQWVPRRPSKFRNFGDGKKIRANAPTPSPEALHDQVSAAASALTYDIS